MTYTNAVLTLILPKIAEFANKLDLPERTCTAADVRRFSPLSGGGGEAGVLFNSGDSYWFVRGYIFHFTSPNAFYIAQDPNQLSRFHGRLNMNKTEAIGLARATIRKLGYAEELLYADLEPEVVTPTIGLSTIPRFLVRWWAANKKSPSAELEINGESRRVESILLVNANLERELPRLPGAPTDPARDREAHALPPEKARSLLLQALPTIEAYASCLNLGTAHPLHPSYVRSASFYSGEYSPQSSVVLSNGFGFYVCNGEVLGFHAPDEFFTSGEVTVKQFAGSWKFTQADAVAIAREAVKRLGYPAALVAGPPSLIENPYGAAKEIVPRCAIHWAPSEKRMRGCSVRCEVDGSSGIIKSLSVIGVTRAKPNLSGAAP